MYFTYILRCSDGSLYSGYCANLEDRVAKHNAGVGAKYTRGRLPVEVVYSEEHLNRSEAMKREAALKKLNKAQKEQVIAAFSKG